MKHLLTPADVQRIQEAAAMMPRIQKKVKRAILGADLIDLGYEDWRGRTIDPTATYEVDAILEANLVVVMTRLCREHGMEAFDAMLDELKTGNPVIAKDGRLMFSRATVGIC